jgi:membrane protease YdiL (CAAX protease family)
MAVSLGLGISGPPLSMAILALVGNCRIGPAAGSASAASFLAGSAAIFTQSSAEELFFRGWLQRALGRSWGEAPALIAASAVFALVHVIGGTGGVLLFGNVFLAGVFFGLLMRGSGGLIAASAAHFGWNWTEIMLLGLSPNPLCWADRLTALRLVLAQALFWRH